MKNLNQYTSEIIEKVRKQKKLNKIKNITLSLAFSFIFIFGVLYSNIIPLSPFDLNKYAYESYKGVYASKEDNTIFSFTNNSFAILSINSVPYQLNTENNTKNEFNFNATKLQNNNDTTTTLNIDTRKNQPTNYNTSNDSKNYLDTTKINIVFYDGGATITGNIYGITITIDVIIIENTVMESGVWKYFNEYHPTSSSVESYIIVNDASQSYFINNNSESYEIMFLSVDGSEHILLLDNYGAPSEFINIIRINEEEFGFSAIKLISNANPDRYFRLMNNNEKINFQSTELTAKFIKAYKKVQNLGYNDMAKYLPIRWRLTPETGYETKILDYSTKINLKQDGSVFFTVYNGNNEEFFEGEWVSTDKNIVVILDNRSIFGKMFVIYNHNESKTFEQTAKSNITIRDGFKTGYHDFNYYLTSTYYTLFWGNEYDEDSVNNRITFGAEYTLNGYYYKWYYDRTLPFSYDIEHFSENGKLKIIPHENGTIDIFNEQNKRTIKYTKRELEKNSFKLVLESSIFIDINEDKKIKIKELYINDGDLRTTQTTFVFDGGSIKNHYIAFVK